MNDVVGPNAAGEVCVIVIIKFWLVVLLVTLALLWVRNSLLKKPIAFVAAFGMATLSMMGIFGFFWLVSLAING
jgi:hypothetical protein